MIYLMTINVEIKYLLKKLFPIPSIKKPKSGSKGINQVSSVIFLNYAAMCFIKHGNINKN